MDLIAADSVLDDFEGDSGMQEKLGKLMKEALLLAEHVNQSCPHYLPAWRNCGCIPKYYPNMDKLLVHTPD